MNRALGFGCFFAVVLAACSVRGGPPDAAVPPADGSSDMGPTIDSPRVTCEPGLIECSGACVRVAADSDHCGSCGNACPDGVSCANGRCDCALPRLSCDGLCAELTTDPAHCGECGNACESTEFCSMGECILVCTAENHEVCVNTDESGARIQVCADLMSDVSNCGGCNTRCAPGVSCIDGVCTCPTGLTACAGGCTDTRTDPLNCGGCLSSCGEGGRCAGGVCTSCAPGLELCGTTTPRCFDTRTSRLHCGSCGRPCGGGEACTDGACDCLGTLTDCGAGCIDLMTDVENCGVCGVDCGEGGACRDGSCTCATGFTMCGPECADLMSDRDHCGGCAMPCAATEACIRGMCNDAPLYHGWTSPIAGCSTTSYDTTTPTVLGGTYPHNRTDSLACRAWKLAATVCTTPPEPYFGNDNWTCPTSGGFTDPVFGTYCASPFTQYSCSTCPAACNATCVYRPLSLRDCSGSETDQM